MTNENVLSSIHSLLDGDEWPELVGFQAADNEATLSLLISKNIHWFTGHFPDQAVLPGVVQVHWATQIARLIFSQSGENEFRFSAANNVKFKTMILPEQTVELVLRYDEAKSTVKFKYGKTDDEFSTGAIIFTLS